MKQKYSDNLAPDGASMGGVEKDNLPEVDKLDDSEKSNGRKVENMRASASAFDLKLQPGGSYFDTLLT